MQFSRFMEAAGGLRRWAEADSPKPGQAIRPYWLLLVLSMAGSAWAAVRLGQDVSWDVLNYHFYVGYAFLHKPLHYDFAPAQVQSFFNPLLHVLSYLLLEYLPSRVAAGLLGAIQGLNLYLVFQISQVLFRRWRAPYRHLISLVNALAGFYGAINTMELGATFGDNLVSIPTLTGLLLVFYYVLVRPGSERRSLLALWIGGASIGVAWALKLTAIIYVAGVVIAIAFVFLPAPGRFRSLIALYGGLAAGFIAAYGYWGFDLVRRYRNPVFPYLNSIFRSPFYDLQNAMDSRFMPRNWQETFFYPFYFVRTNNLVSEVVFRDARLACCYVAVLLMAAYSLFRVFRRVRGKAVRVSPAEEAKCLAALSLFFVISYIAWQYVFSVYRYLAVLELLAPTLLALSLAWFFRNKTLVLGVSLVLSLTICWRVIPMNYGRQNFDNEFLKVEIPPIPELERSVVLMFGEEATSYMVPRFPATTRFVRLSSNFLMPGRNAHLDLEIREILARYDIARILAYVSNPEEVDLARNNLAYFGFALDGRPCWEIRAKAGTKGYLCRVMPIPKPEKAMAREPEPAKSAPAPPVPRELAPRAAVPGEQKLVSIPTVTPQFRNLENVHLEVTPSEAIAGRDTIQYRVAGLKAKAIDVLYTIDGNPMPAVRNWSLDARQSVSILVGTTSRKGEYHIIGIRDSAAPDRNLWISVDARVRIR